MMKIKFNSEKSSNFVPQSNSRQPMLVIESKKKKLETLKKEYPGGCLKLRNFQ